MSNAPALGDSWVPEGFDPNNPGKSITYMTSDSSSDRVWNSSLIAVNNLTGTSNPSYICDSYFVAECNSNSNTRVFAILPLCDGAIKVACVEELRVGGKVLERQGKTAIDFPEDLSRNLPAGSMPSLWRDPAANTLYLAKVVAYAWPFSNNPNFSLSVDVWKVEESICPACEKLKPVKYSQTSVSTGSIPASKSAVCVWMDSGVCYKSSPLDLNKTIGISFKSPELWLGWVFARTKDAEYSIKYEPNSNPIHNFTALPIQVPVLGKSYANPSDIPDGIVEAVGNTNPAYFLNLGVEEIRRIVTYNDFGQKVIEFLGSKPDTTDYLDSAWRFTTLSGSQQTQSGLYAVLQTNSLTWNYQLPEFKKDEFLLKVSGKHYNPDGSVASGFYQMLIPSSVANSRWGDLGQEAKLSITYENSSGSTLVQTSTLRNESGWFRATIAGYHYSNGTLHFKLEKSLSVINDPAPLTTKAKITIKCMKGKRIIQKTGKNPNCPTGYKKIA